MTDSCDLSSDLDYGQHNTNSNEANNLNNSMDNNFDDTFKIIICSNILQ